MQHAFAYVKYTRLHSRPALSFWVILAALGMCCASGVCWGGLGAGMHMAWEVM